MATSRDLVLAVQPLLEGGFVIMSGAQGGHVAGAGVGQSSLLLTGLERWVTLPEEGHLLNMSGASCPHPALHPGAISISRLLFRQVHEMVAEVL